MPSVEIDVAAFALAIRAVGAAVAHTFVNLDAEPCEGVDDILLCAGNKAL